MTWDDFRALWLMKREFYNMVHGGYSWVRA
jgi:hypothetical protein